MEHRLDEVRERHVEGGGEEGGGRGGARRERAMTWRGWPMRAAMRARASFGRESIVVKNGRSARVIGRLVGGGDHITTNRLVGRLFADETN